MRALTLINVLDELNESEEINVDVKFSGVVVTSRLEGVCVEDGTVLVVVDSETDKTEWVPVADVESFEVA